MDSELTSLLQKTGLTQKEARVYLALLELGKADIGDISRLSGLKRPIIYIIIEELLKKGCVTQLPDKKVNTYQAIDPLVILSQLKTTAKYFSEMIPFLHSLSNKGKKRPKLHFIEGRGNVWKNLTETIQEKEGFYISSYSKINKFYPNSINDFINKEHKIFNQVRGRHIIPDNEEDIALGKELTKVKQLVRILPKKEDVGMDFALYKNRLSITLFEENPFAVTIESEELAKSLRTIFEVVWENSKEIE
jgi:HTH-type transcriptional regulator, sugar sensing transcriptional regulator